MLDQSVVGLQRTGIVLLVARCGFQIFTISFQYFLIILHPLDMAYYCNILVYLIVVCCDCVMETPGVIEVQLGVTLSCI